LSISPPYAAGRRGGVSKPLSNAELPAAELNYDSRINDFEQLTAFDVALLIKLVLQFDQ